MKKVRFGIVGLGNQGTYYTSLFDGGEIPDGEITAMCDIAPSKIRAMRERGERGVRYFSDYREMLDSGLCDAVLIETPHYLHPEIAEGGPGTSPDRRRGAADAAASQSDE